MDSACEHEHDNFLEQTLLLLVIADKEEKLPRCKHCYCCSLRTRKKNFHSVRKIARAKILHPNVLRVICGLCVVCIANRLHCVAEQQSTISSSSIDVHELLLTVVSAFWKLQQKAKDSASDDKAGRAKEAA